MTFKRIFIAGTIQGSNQGWNIEDQSYRTALASILETHLPGVECFDPSTPVLELLATAETRDAVQQMLGSLSEATHMDSAPDAVQKVRTAFREMTSEAAKCDLCIAYLPNSMPSMGTAMEMYAAHLSGVPVVTITDMVQNLSIVSISDWIFSDIPAFENWVAKRASVEEPTAV
ncbi:hypothetical protein J7I98_28325 [Streptomyces sp. ISL-98]|uniref:hypothetical protein n=1 Tax=Streptomyces sp. ISL-98 TaxID=2819192 RepID=UPI001BE82382|nr:hypothetical protein [Streptomyces sp. ISL-98]MBT2509711.1 hypothetical protein [Streptomyces sp. ISL-98]